MCLSENNCKLPLKKSNDSGDFTDYRLCLGFVIIMVDINFSCETVKDLLPPLLEINVRLKSCFTKTQSRFYYAERGLSIILK